MCGRHFLLQLCLTSKNGFDSLVEQFIYLPHYPHRRSNGARGGASAGGTGRFQPEQWAMDSKPWRGEQLFGAKLLEDTGVPELCEYTI